MTATYSRIKEALTKEELRQRYVALVDGLGLGDPDDLIDEVAYELRRNVQLVDACERAGVSLGKTVDIEHWAYFSIASNAKKFARTLTKNHNGFRARVEERVDDRWPVVIRSRSDLQLLSVGKVSVTICMLALSHKGWYDGFEATIEGSAATNIESILGDRMTNKQLAGTGIAYRPRFELPTKGVSA